MAAPGGAASLAGKFAGKGIAGLARLGARAGAAAGGGAGAIVGGAAGGALGGAATAPLVGGALAAGQTAVQGDVTDAPRAGYEAAKATLKDPLAMAGGAVLGGLGGASQGIRSGDTQTGQDLRLVEEFGGSPRLLTGAKGGAFESPILRDRRGTTGEVGEVAREAGDSIRTGLNAKTKALQDQYAAGKRRLATDDFVASPSRRRADSDGTQVMADPNFVPEGVIPRGDVTKPRPTPAGSEILDTAPMLDATSKLLESKRLPASAKAAIKSEVLDVLEESGGRMSVDDFNDFRGKLQDLSKVGEPGAKAHFRTLYKAAKDIIDDTEYGQLNATYSKGIEAQKRRHRQLGLGRTTTATDIEDPIAAKKVARVVRRQDENTATAGQEAVDVQRFIEENPEFRNALAASRLLSAKGRLRVGVPETGGLYERVGGLAMRNAEPLLGSVVYPAGKAVGDTAAAKAPGIIRLLEEAAAQRRRQDEERSRTLLGQ
ncbi:MAG: hypothetical protein ABJA82_01860 [Myxococcales bacterium]